MAYTDMNLVLYVAMYGEDTAAARKDYRALKELDDYGVIASVFLTREANGDVDVDEHGGMHVGRGATMGGVAGLVVGLFAPQLLAATAVGAGIGVAAGKIAKHHDEEKIESAVDDNDWLPPGCSCRRCLAATPIPFAKRKKSCVPAAFTSSCVPASGRRPTSRPRSIGRSRSRSSATNARSVSPASARRNGLAKC